MVTFEPQLGIRIHVSLTAKKVLNPYHRLGGDIYPKLNNELRDQAGKRKPSSVVYLWTRA
jgi:hypothetical protein